MGFHGRLQGYIYIYHVIYYNFIALPLNICFQKTTHRGQTCEISKINYLTYVTLDDTLMKIIIVTCMGD
jgi:hypothetical protein